MSVLRIYGALASLIDTRLAGLVHESVIDDAAVRFRHERFLVSRLATGLVMMLGLPPYLLLRGVPSGIEALAIASLLLPVFAAVLLSRTGILWVAHAISSAGLTGLVVCLAMMTGGANSAAAIWLVAIPLEAVVSGSRRATLAAAIVAALGALAVAFLPPLGVSGVLMEWSRTLAMPVFAITAIGHITAQAIEHFRHEGRWLAKLRDNELRDRMLLSAIDDLVTWHDCNGRVIEASASSARFIGAEASRLRGHGLLERVHVGDRPALLQTLSDVAAHGVPATVQFRLQLDAAAVRAEGAPRVIFAEMRAHRIDAARTGLPNALASGSSVVAVTRDVTEHRRHAEELERARAEAERADEVKSRFLATVSHELRTPLNAIIGFSEVLAGEGAMTIGPEQSREYAVIIGDSGKHLLDVVNTLLDMSRIQSGHFDYAPETFDLNALVRTCCDLMQLRAVKAGVVLVRSDDTAPIHITADLRACRQMMINLLSNAVKFTPSGGRVEVAIRQAGHHLDLIVTDTGIGIAADDLPRVGDPFFQAQSDTRRSHEGTGLGLSVVQGLVGLHSGAIAIESVPGQGTSVIVTLPVTCRTQANLAGPAPIRTASRVPGATDTARSPAPIRRPIGLFEASSEPVRESYVPDGGSPLRRAG
ncbi:MULTISPECIES: PAS domain-containing sensor histidine kinase [unclassified Methylobacterium]|uniref:PAS domain-containing sensor histidine kinase n=1 Tax=unclassified Methylobacterium TaxID=2615210 RepID=UPI0006FFBD17|nr:MULTISPECIES: PAS domain-containing sensor histidine kinase [unclassified Methylobacterium]KQP32146.1 PAS domain-containing sensor histidine kinase [Methylobacterium sp. Leaf100]KQP65927.1 PAS domain-containing sensor histidine kinase [Methylobacterium sp. Leaf112]